MSPPLLPRSHHRPGRCRLLKALARGSSSPITARASTRPSPAQPCWAMGTQSPWEGGRGLGRGGTDSCHSPCLAMEWWSWPLHRHPTVQTPRVGCRGWGQATVCGGTGPHSAPGVRCGMVGGGLCQSTQCCRAGVTHLLAGGPPEMLLQPQPGQAARGGRAVPAAAGSRLVFINQRVLLLSAPLPPRWGSRCRRQHPRHAPPPHRGLATGATGATPLPSPEGPPLTC